MLKSIDLTGYARPRANVCTDFVDDVTAVQPARRVNEPVARPNDPDASTYAVGTGDATEINVRFAAAPQIAVAGRMGHQHGGKTIEWRSKRLWRPVTYSGPDLEFIDLADLSRQLQ